MFKPYHDRILARVLNDVADKDSKGVLIPETSKDAPQRAVVLRVGAKVTVGCVEGTIVLFSKFGGKDITVDGEKLKTFMESELIGEEEIS